MVENKVNKQSQFENLKELYILQTHGNISTVLNNLKQVKQKVEQIVKVVGVKQQEIHIKNANEPKVEVKKEPTITTTPKVEEKDIDFKQAFLESEQKKQQPKPLNNKNNSNYNRIVNFNNNNNYKSQNNFNNNRFNNSNNQNNNYNRYNNQNNQNGQNKFQQKPFNNNTQQKPFNNNGQRPFGNTQNKPFGNKGTNFVSAKTNNFRSFQSAPLESASVLAPTERTFGNKNKTSTRSLEEKKTHNKKSLIRLGYNNNSNYNPEDDITMGSRKSKGKKEKQQVVVAPKIENAVITTPNLTVKILSEKTQRPVTEIIKQLMILGIIANINSNIDFETAELVASELGVKLELKLAETMEEKLVHLQQEQKGDDKDYKKRPPVVTIMGHVDHGKTSLLDAIRKTNVTSSEAGGITQRIGAYTVKHDNEIITFIDTPGHEAFTSMRERGAKVTDVAILVVAADDGIMPQTLESIKHIKNADIPMIVAINKIDKKEVNIERVKQQLAEHDVLCEDWGGDTVMVPVSAKQGIGIDKLLDMIILVTDVQELKANATTKASGTILEAELDKGKGPVATVLVQNGTLKIGSNVVCGMTYGKIKAMYDENGKQVRTAGPSIPVSILGLNEVPSSGDLMVEVDEKFSKQVIAERKYNEKLEQSKNTSGVSLDNFMDKVNEGKFKYYNVIVKADVKGSAEAIEQSISRISNEEVKVHCILSEAGAVTENDVMMAETSNAVIISFNNKVNSKVKWLSDKHKIEILSYKVIYEVIDELTKRIDSMVTPKYEERVIGHAEVRMVFKITGSGLIAGSYVLDGKIQRNAKARLIRNEEVVLETSVDALKIQKDDKPEVNFGYECGIKLKDVTDLKVGDKIECYVLDRIN